ncbi:MAG TPA: LamG domain-containing protein, partial [Kofleriaceae bacterium]|nr:LamG domain-containing protein [Kofleriaceae bacterium]
MAVASAAACQELTPDLGERSAVAHGELVSGLVAAYGFEEGGGATTADSSGNNLTGSLAGTAWVATGKFGKALSFNGSSSMVSIPDAGALDLTTGMTLSAWIKPTSLRGWPCVLMKERAGELTYALYASSPGSQPNIDYTHNGVEVNLLGSPPIAVGTWTHLAGTFDGATLRLYVNATQIASMATANAIDATTGALRIGGNTVWTEYFDG